MIAMRQYADKSLAGSYNVGPDDTDCYTTGDLVDLFCKKWEQRTKKGSIGLTNMMEVLMRPTSSNLYNVDANVAKLCPILLYL